MKMSQPTTASTRFSRYATASAVALGAAAAADAQFLDTYSLTSGSGNTGAWNQSLAREASIDLGGAPDTLALSAWNTYGGVATLMLASPVTEDTMVSFDWSTGGSSWGTDNMAAYFYDGTGYQAFWVLHSSPSTSGHATFLVTAGSTFGFQWSVNYSHGGGTMTIANFAAIPEAGTTSLLAGVAALGFIAVAGARARRHRAAQPAK